MDHGKGAGTTEPAPVGPAGDAGDAIKPGGTKTVLRPSLRGLSILFWSKWVFPVCPEWSAWMEVFLDVQVVATVAWRDIVPRCLPMVHRCRHGSSSWNGKQKWSSASRACPTSSPALACLRLCSPRLRLESGAFGTDRWRAGTRQRREQPSASLRPKASVSPSLR